MQEVRPGLYRWTALHPDWTPDEGGPDGWDPEVASYLYESPDGLILFDPLSPDWDDVDRRVAALGPPHVLLTLYWHARSAAEIAERYPGTRVWAHEAQRDEFAKRVRDASFFALGDPLPVGIEAREPREVVYWVPEHRALVAGDVLLGTADGGVRVLPDSWLGEKTTREQQRDALRALLDLPIELVLLTHGEAAPDGHRALREAIEA